MENEIAVGVGYYFSLVNSEETSNIELVQTGSYVKIDGVEYPLYKATTYEDSKKLDNLLDKHKEYSVKDYKVKTKEIEGRSR